MLVRRNAGMGDCTMNADGTATCSTQSYNVIGSVDSPNTQVVAANPQTAAIQSPYQTVVQMPQSVGDWLQANGGMVFGGAVAFLAFLGLMMAFSAGGRRR